ncbi:MAG: bifunctional anthranilate synthase component II/anthranilate phosphoribosyltransferase [Lachnospiraceae bacterium]|nr:bifunctional anthranilate synthase component II/anthranilate phosphoribosyltransferase [Lachnospiraceae bacterium]
MILLIDNYDSFSYNVYQLVGSINPDMKVIRNDEMTPEEIEALAPSHIILSPGPGRPADAGICEEVIRHFQGRIPILGICLGHQAICEVYGAAITYARELMHGKQSTVSLDNDSKLFAGMKKQITVARYHSLAADPDTLPDCLKITASTQDGEVMAVQHREYPVYGVQFHPESVLTPEGKAILENFLSEKEIVPDRGSENKNRKEEKNMIREAIIKLSKKEDIGYEMAKAVMNEIMSGEATDVQKSAYLTALSMKGETIEEITGSAEEMRRHGTRLLHEQEVLEIVGTGGDGSNSFNISTTAALIIAAAGVPVAKHGNRAASSRSGAADCLEALGVNINLEPEQSLQLLNDIHICFLFAQKYHSAMKYVGPIRKELGIRTVFNILGPLTNPAGANMEVMGVYEEALVEVLAEVLLNLGVTSGMTVYGQDKLDEISVCAPTTICEIRNGQLKKYVITPEQFGLKTYDREQLLGGSPAENAAITRAVLSGQERGAKRDAVVINAAAGLYVAGKAEDLQAGVKLAQEIIDSGRAMEQLEQFVQRSQALAGAGM